MSDSRVRNEDNRNEDSEVGSVSYPRGHEAPVRSPHVARKQELVES